MDAPDSNNGTVSSQGLCEVILIIWFRRSLHKFPIVEQDTEGKPLAHGCTLAKGKPAGHGIPDGLQSPHPPAR